MGRKIHEDNGGEHNGHRYAVRRWYTEDPFGGETIRSLISVSVSVDGRELMGHEYLEVNGDYERAAKEYIDTMADKGRR